MSDDETLHQVARQCSAIRHLATVLAIIHGDYARTFAAGAVGAIGDLADIVGNCTAGFMETLGDMLNGMDAASEDDEWLSPIFKAAQQRWPQPGCHHCGTLHIVGGHGNAMITDQWQPIETAPKDGTRVLLLRDNHPVCGRWCHDKHAQEPRPYWTHDQERLFGKRGARDRPPTHWRPLPAPPASNPAGVSDAALEAAARP